MKIDQENIEEYILLLLDGELDAASEAELRDFLDSNENYKPLLEAYQATVLPADENIVFPGKEQLLREEGEVVPIRKRAWPVRRAAAAAILLIAGAITFRFAADKSQNEGQDITIALQQKPVVPPVPPASQPLTAAPAAAVASVKNVKHMPAAEKKKQASSLPEPVAASTTRGQSPLERIPVLDEGIALATAAVPPAAELERIESAEPLIAEADDKHLPAWLPFKEENMQGLSDLLSQIQIIKAGVREKAEALKGSTFVIRVGEKEIALGKKSF